MLNQDGRRAERIKSLLRAQISFNNHLSTVDCVIKNISPLGAKLLVNEAMSVPDQFELHVPRRGRTYVARMVWRDPEAVGVEFVGEVGEPALETPGDADQRVNELQLEVAELKARVRALSKRLTDLGQNPDLAA